MILAAIALAAAIPVATSPQIPTSFPSVGDDRRAIDALLADYTRAVSTRNQALFESILLDRDIPFSSAESAVKRPGTPTSTHDYESFRKGVFEGTPFTQRFQDVHVLQDGPLATVTLVFVNTTATESDWGWKTMQLLKVAGRWKIASEFYTGH